MHRIWTQGTASIDLRRLAQAWAWLRVLAGSERRRLVLFLPVAMGTGVASYFGFRAEPRLWPVLGAAALLALLAAATRGEFGRRVALAGLAFSLGLLSPMLETRRALPVAALPRHAVVIEGTVGAIDLLPGGGSRLTIDRPSLDGAVSLARRIRVRLRDTDPLAARDGDVIRVRALLRPPSPPAYPGAWDLQRDAFFSGLAGSGFAIGEAVRVGGPHGSDVAEWWNGVRDTVARRFETGLPGPTGAVAATLMVGRSTAIPPQDRAAFTDSGLAHLLAVAGLHIGIVMGLAMGLVRNGLACWPYAALRWPVRQIASVGALAAGGIYLLLTGAHLPIVRSFCMAALATLGIAMGRRAVSMRGLCVAAAVILALWPDALTGVSFQMSFAAVAALIAGYEVLRPWFTRLANGTAGRRFGLHVAALALTSVLAGTASAPYAAYHFGQIQIYFVLANVVAVPITATVVMPCGLAAMALMPFGFEAVALWPMKCGLAAILWIGRTVSAMPDATFAVPHMPIAGLLIVSAGIAILCLLRTRLRLAGIALIGAGCLSPMVSRPPDLLVSDDARLIALHRGADIMIAKRSGAAKFTLEAYERFWAAARDPVALPAAGTFRLARDGQQVLLVADEAAVPDCTGASLVVAAFPLRDRCAGLPRIDRFSVWRDGAAAAWLTPAGVRVVTDREWRGARPWVPPPPLSKARTRKPRLPVATAE